MYVRRQSKNGPSLKHARIESYISQQHDINEKFVNAITGNNTSLLETTLTDDEPDMPVAQMDAVKIESESGEKVSGVHYALKKEMWDIADYLIEKGVSVKGCVGLIVTRFVNHGDVEGLRLFSQNYNESVIEELVRYTGNVKRNYILLTDGRNQSSSKRSVAGL